MELKPCRACGQEVSDQAETCPHCGIKAPGIAPAPQETKITQVKVKPKIWNGCLVVVGILIVLFLLFAVIASIGRLSSLPSSSPPVTQISTPAPPKELAWKEALPGTAATLGDDGGGGDLATVCDTEHHAKAVDGRKRIAGCRTFKHGRHVTIEQVPDETSGFVKIEISSNGFVGFVRLAEIYPIVPLGTIMHLKQQGDASLMLAPSYAADLDSGINLGQQATAKVVRFEPTYSGNRQFYVTILDGKYAGSSGWVFDLYVNGDDGEPLDMFSTKTALTETQSSAPATPAPSKNMPSALAKQNLASPGLVGTQARMIMVAMGCPDLYDIKIFMIATEKASKANDAVGKSNAVTAASQAGCNSFKIGDQGLVIGTSDDVDYLDVRMERDSNSYWVPIVAMAPLPGQPPSH